MDDVSAFQLCSKCSEIPFDFVFSGEADIGFQRWQLMIRDEWTEACSLCSYLVRCLSMGVKLHCHEQRTDTHITLHSLYTGNLDVKYLAVNVLSKDDLKHIFSLGPILCVTRKWQRTAGQPEAVPPLLSYSTITNWIKKAIGNLEPRDELVSLSGMIVPLKVIDCITRNLILLPEKEPYVTLSYVWGSVDPGKISIQSEKNGRESLPAQLPATIEDCITVCLGLNFRYLWIDRYCVYGTNDMRMQQIKEMDKVYSESALTVIACAGADPTYGLPGVSRSRTSYLSLKVKDLGYLWEIPSTKDITNSIWATRGWTFQEALLSKCQLYFTDKQLFLGLYDTIKSESGGWVPKETVNIWQDKYSLGALGAYSCIQEYSKRHLSYPEDTLDAVLGILSRLQKDRGVLHLWGLPFRGSDRTMTTDVVFPHELVFEKSLCWQAAKPSRRRKGFPTWSWTSNDSRIFWPPTLPLDVLQKSPNLDMTPKFEVELVSGELCSLSEYQLRYNKLNSYSEALTCADRPSRFIHVEAFVSPVVNIETHDTGYMIVVKSTTGESISIHVSRDTTSASTSPESALIIHLLYDYRGDDCGDHVLFVGNMGTYWERVGYVGNFNPLITRANKVRKKIRLG